MHKERLWKAQQSVDEAAKHMTGIHRQRYHFMAPAYWINDPNGCVFFDGAYHLFYQHNPYAPVWGSMHWGHAISKNLVDWKHLPIALAPSEPYDDHPEGGVFSGSALSHQGALYLFYTGCTKADGLPVQVQCMAKSVDGGITFEKHPENPIIRQPPPGISSDFRDPKVLRVKDKWYMLIGASRGGGAQQGGDGCLLMYRSEDLEHWEERGVVASSNGAYGTMWECPDLFYLDGKWVLTFSPMLCGNRKVVYQVGEMDFEGAVFHCEAQGEIDWGQDYYAAQSFQGPEGQIVLIAWQNSWDWMPWWHGHGPTAAENWRGSMALPREVVLEADHTLSFHPIKELEGLRSGRREEKNLSIEQERHLIPCANSVCFELYMEIDLEQTTADILHLFLRDDGEQRIRLSVDISQRLLVFDRGFGADVPHGLCSCPLELEGATAILRIFSDVSSLEVFADDSRTTMSHAIYAARPDQCNTLCAENGTAHILRLTVWELIAC